MFKLIKKRKLIILITAVVLVGGGYYFYKLKNDASAQTHYILGKVEKGAIIATVSASGQVSASNQLEIKSKASGDVLNVFVKNGQELKSGDILAQLDAKDVYKSMRDAETNLESAKLSLEKLKKPATTYSIMQAENALADAKSSLEKLKLSQETNYQKAEEAKKKAEDNITKAYEDAFNAISNAFLNLPTIITELNDTLYSVEIAASETTVNDGQENGPTLINTVGADDTDHLRTFLTGAQNDYQAARLKYNANSQNYKNASRYSERAVIESLLTETLETTKSIAEAAKSENNLLDEWTDGRTKRGWPVFLKVKEYQANLATYIGQTNNHLSSLLSIQRTLADNREALLNAERGLKEMAQNNPLDLAAAEAKVREKEASLADLKADADYLDIESQELAVKQRQNAFLDAKEKLADYTIRAPFDGVIAQIDIKKGDSLSANAAVATLIAKQRIAEVSLNEVDVAKIKVGQKIILTFSAIDGLSISGEVAEINAIGTISQNVVTYGVKIAFDTQDDRIKPQMSISASIITNEKLNTIMAPNSAIKTDNNGASYVETLNIGNQTADTNGVISLTPPARKNVEIGLSNETNTEIVSGLREGDQIIIRTVSNMTVQTTTQNSGFRLFGGGR